MKTHGVTEKAKKNTKIGAIVFHEIARAGGAGGQATKDDGLPRRAAEPQPKEAA
jgi:hypothetical protein